MVLASTVAHVLKYYKSSTSSLNHMCTKYSSTVVPALGDPRRERPPALYGHVINAPTDTFQR